MVRMDCLLWDSYHSYGPHTYLGNFAFRVIPHEEGLLEELFGDEYLECKRTVRRWIGRN
jgi:protein-S-isoprenylcysteine O-methyltransferase Ste14